MTLLTSLTANMNRDSKKKKEPYTIEDFYMFQPQSLRDVPSGSYGAAAMALVQSGNYPIWALFVYKALKESASGSPPSVLALLCEDAMILAPREGETPGTIKGMLVGKETSSEAKRVMTSPCGEVEVYVSLPKADSKVFATEDITINIIS